MAALVFTVRLETVVTMEADDTDGATYSEQQLRATLAQLAAQNIALHREAGLIDAESVSDFRLIELRAEV